MCLSEHYSLPLKIGWETCELAAFPKARALAGLRAADLLRGQDRPAGWTSTGRKGRCSGGWSVAQGPCPGTAQGSSRRTGVCMGGGGVLPPHPRALPKGPRDGPGDLRGPAHVPTHACTVFGCLGEDKCLGRGGSGRKGDSFPRVHSPRVLGKHRASGGGGRGSYLRPRPRVHSLWVLGERPVSGAGWEWGVVLPPPTRAQSKGPREGLAFGWGGRPHAPRPHVHSLRVLRKGRESGGPCPSPPPTRAQPGGALGLGGAAGGHVAPQECAGVWAERGRGRAGVESNGLPAPSKPPNQTVGVELPPCGRGRGASQGGSSGAG